MWKIMKSRIILLARQLLASITDGEHQQPKVLLVLGSLVQNGKETVI